MMVLTPIACHASSRVDRAERNEKTRTNEGYRGTVHP